MTLPMTSNNPERPFNHLQKFPKSNSPIPQKYTGDILGVLTEKKSYDGYVSSVIKRLKESTCHGLYRASIA